MICPICYSKLEESRNNYFCFNCNEEFHKLEKLGVIKSES